LPNILQLDTILRKPAIMADCDFVSLSDISIKVNSLFDLHVYRIFCDGNICLNSLEYTYLYLISIIVINR